MPKTIICQPTATKPKRREKPPKALKPTPPNAVLYNITTILGIDVGRLGYVKKPNGKLGNVHVVCLSSDLFPVGCRRRQRLFDQIRYAVEIEIEQKLIDINGQKFHLIKI